MATRVYERIVGEDLDLGTGTATITNPGGGSLVGTQIGLHTFAVTGLAVEATWDPASLANLASDSTTVTVSGADVDDFVIVTHDQLGTNKVLLGGVVSSSNTVSVTLLNVSGGSLDIASGTLRVVVLKAKS